MRTFASVVSILSPGGTGSLAWALTFLYSGSMFCWQSAVLFGAPKGPSVFFVRNPQIVDEDQVNVLTVPSASALVHVVHIG